MTQQQKHKRVKVSLPHARSLSVADLANYEEICERLIDGLSPAEKSRRAKQVDLWAQVIHSGRATRGVAQKLVKSLREGLALAEEFDQREARAQALGIVIVLASLLAGLESMAPNEVRDEVARLGGYEGYASLAHKRRCEAREEEDDADEPLTVG